MPSIRTLLVAPALLAAAWPALAGELTSGQLDAASRVFVGNAQCDHNQQVSLSAVPGQPGHFKLNYKKASYTLVPEETTTGAVRLEDKKAGIVWLQIPAKSMLMNAKVGQRVLDGCKHAEQNGAKMAASTQ